MMEDLVLTIEQCRHLQELGLDMTDAKMCWAKAMDEYIAVPKTKDMLHPERVVPTYTIQEILDRFPEMIRHDGMDYLYEMEHEGGEYCIAYSNSEKWLISLADENFLTVAYDVLCWLCENGHLEEIGS